MDEYRRFAEAQGIKTRAHAYREGDVSRDGRGIGQSDASGKRSLEQPCATMAEGDIVWLAGTLALWHFGSDGRVDCHVQARGGVY
jgi:hypothetical protein